ncbi:MAG: glycosyltransferase family 4 protein [Planctomycetota bacterium]
MPEVVHIITRMILGGAQENTLYTVEGLDRLGDWQTLLVTGPAIGPEGELLNRARANGVRVEVVDSMRRAINPLRDGAAYLALKRILKRERPEIVHTHSSKAGILGRAAARAAGVPVVVHTIHGLPFHPYQNALVNRTYIALERWAAVRSDHIITVCDAMAEKAADAGVAPPGKFTTVYSGMEVDTFLRASSAREEVRARLEVAPDAPLVGKVARLFHLKGHKYLIDAMPAVLEKFPATKFLFVGDGILKNALWKRAESLGVADSIIFAGLVEPDEVPRMVAAMDLLVHCSLREGLARVLPQAFLAGIPVISYDIDGAREVVESGRTGWLLAPEEVDGLSAAMIEALSDPVRAREMALKGREFCREAFSVERMVEKITGLYELLLGCGS